MTGRHERIFAWDGKTSVNSQLSTRLSTHSYHTLNVRYHTFVVFVAECLICQLTAINSSVNSQLSTRLSTHSYHTLNVRYHTFVVFVAEASSRRPSPRPKCLRW